MGLIILIVPLLIYYVVLVPIIKKGILDKQIKSKRNRMIALSLVILFPIGDHIVGYIVYKTLCFTKGGVHIYKTVTDKQEQRDYWFSKNMVSGVLDEKSKFFTNLDKKLKRMEVPFSKKVTFRKMLDGKYSSGYLNYCNSKYDSLPKDDPNYRRSCKNADEIIQKYHLENVIKVPKSKYGMYVSSFDKNYDSNLPILFIKVNQGKIYNLKTGEILAEYREYGFGGGWYVHLVSPLPFGVGCGDTRLSKFQEKVIPNPYKTKN